jgi:hypothetical protein
MRVEPTLRLPKTPSWVPFWHRERFRRFSVGPLEDLPPITLTGPRRSFIKGDILTVYGLIFDSIETVTENISPKKPEIYPSIPGKTIILQEISQNPLRSRMPHNKHF